MRIFGHELPGYQQERQELAAARRELEDVGERHQAAGIDWETDEYLDANSAVIDAEQQVPWYLR